MDLDFSWLHCFRSPGWV